MDKLTLEEIKRQYSEESICMSELLADIDATGLTMEEAFNLYAEAIKWSDGDIVEIIQD